jgi:hypothetical protein
LRPCAAFQQRSGAFQSRGLFATPTWALCVSLDCSTDLRA